MQMQAYLSNLKSDDEDRLDTTYREIDDIGEEHIINMYLVTTKSDFNTQFELRIKNVSSLRRPIIMTRRDENIYHTQIAVKEYEMRELNEIRYSYVRQSVAEMLEPNEESEVERTKSKKFLKLHSFFDTFQTKKQFLPNSFKQENQDTIIRFFLKNYNIKEQPFGKPQIFQEYADFCKEDGQQFSVKALFPALQKEFMSKFNDNNFNLYIIELFSIFDIKSLKSKSKYVEPLLREMQQRTPFGYYRRLIPQESNRENYPKKLLEGIQTICILNPLLGLEFFNDNLIIPNQEDYLKTLNLYDVNSHSYFKQAIKLSFQELNFSKRSLQMLAEKSLEVKSLDDFINTFEEMQQFFFERKQTINFIKSNIKMKISDKQLKDFVRVHLDRLVQCQELLIAFKYDIRIQIFLNLKSQTVFRGSIAHLLAYPKLLKMGYFQTIVQIKENPFLQDEFKQIVLRYLTYTKIMPNPIELQKLFIYNFINLIEAHQNLKDQYEILSQYMDLLNHEVFSKIHNFNMSDLLIGFRVQMVEISKSKNLQNHLTDLVQIQNKDQGQQQKVDQVIEVVNEIIKQTHMNEMIVHQIFNTLFSQHKILFQAFKPIAEQAFKFLKVHRSKQTNIYEDDLILSALKISQNYQGNEFLEDLQNEVKSFIKRMKEKSILLKEINSIIVNKKRNLEVILRLIDPNIDLQMLNELAKINKIFQEQVSKHSNFVNWASKSNMNIATKKYEVEIAKIKNSEENLTAQKASSQDTWIHFQMFSTVDNYYHFKDSLLFQNLFMYLPEEAQKQGYIFEENKQSPDSAIQYISMSQFDKVSQDLLFGIICLYHFQNLLKYPNTQISYEVLQRFWSNIHPERVERELQYVRDFQRMTFHNPDLQLPPEIQDHLTKYGNMFIYNQKALILITIEAYANGSTLDVNLDSSFQKLKKYTEYVQEQGVETNLQVIANEVEQVQDFFSNLEFNKQIKWESIEDLSKSKDTFEFSIQNIGLNFNDLYEHLDEFSYITSETISHMNSVSNFFNNLYQAIQNQPNIDFLQLLKFISNELQKEIFNDKEDFRKKLHQCNVNLYAIRQIADSSKNVAENTLQIIDESLEKGIFIWTKENDKFDFKLKVIYDQNYQHREEEEKKEQVKAQQDQQEEKVAKGKREVVFEQDKVNQHCSRAILLIHSRKTNPAQQTIIEENVNTFAQAVTLSTEILSNLKDLSSYGQIQYQKDNLEIKYKIEKKTLIADMQKRKSILLQELEDWKNQLSYHRKKYYFLTYVPNQMIAQLIFANDTRDIEEFKKCIAKLREYKILEESHLSLDQVDFLKRNIFEIIQDYWREGQKNLEANHNLKIDRKGTMFSLTYGKTQFKYVQEDLSLIRSIISIFHISGLQPMWSDVLFATEDTQTNEIETFVLRAMMCPSSQKTNRVFCIANFQKLPFTTQSSSYDFIKKQEQYYHQDGFCLYVISSCQDIRQARLIEEVRSSQLFQQYINQDLLRDFFKRFEHIKVLKSEYCGLGKSEHIKNVILKNSRNIMRVPIYGELTRSKLIRLHRQRINSTVAPFDIHYDVYPTTKEELNVIMFEILILGCLNDPSNQMFQMPKNSKIFIEISQSLNEDYNLYFFYYFKNFEQKWNFTNIKVGNDRNDKVQKVCRYLSALDDEAKYKIEDLVNPKHLLTDLECQVILRDKLTIKLRQPNYYYVNSYINFVHDQIKRMEESPFFTQQNLENQMTGWLGIGTTKKATTLHREIIKQLNDLSMKISVVEKYQDAVEAIQDIQKRSITEKQANRLRDLNWDVFNNPFIVFNDSGTITPIFKRLEDVPIAIIEYQKRLFKKAQDSIKRYDDMTQDDYIEKILEICVDEGQKEKLRKSKDLKSLVFTLDNFMKLVLIYLRIRSFQPIILMGETGVGKTSLVEYLAKVIDAEFRVLNVHAGVSEQETISFVEEAQKIAKCQDYIAGVKRKIILFFDEINTNINISGLLKEIFIDRHINGQPLEENICLVSACNPYKLNAKELSGLTTGFKLNKSDQSMSRLVYKVLPLPESLIPFIWDYKSLDRDEEIKYISKMIEKTFESGKIFGANLSLLNLWVFHNKKSQQEIEKFKSFSEEIRHLSEIVQLCQIQINSLEDCNWAVSLRDVQRFCKLYIYFYNNNTTKDYEQLRVKPPEKLKFGSRDIATVLAIYFCYVIRLSNKDQRKRFNQILQIEGVRRKIDCLKEDNFFGIVNKEQDRFLDQMEINRGIGKSHTLKENIFVIITCVLNQIPLIITGKPGSSKTLAMNLINKSFKGSISSRPFFKNFPAFLPFYYQGSEQSTSSGIIRIYKRAHKTQEKFEERKEQVVVIFDEIGLAENSPHNPLKVLHSLLEPPRVATVGISNWALDASKMNRVITLSRTDPEMGDLLDSARSIARDSIQIFQYLEPLVEWYLYFIQRQESILKYKNFHGLRDFYSMIKHISNKITTDEEKNASIILNGIQRNFGGRSFDNIKQTLEKKLQLKNWDALQKVKPDELIKENLEDSDSRHLMIITDNFENTLQFIQDECQNQKRQYDIFYGSDFPDDQNEESIYKQINEIILQMENGNLCIFLNLKNIYQAFYDMLNQNYQEIGNQRFCKVAIGPDSSRCLVHEKFKCVLIVDHNQIEELDPPLLNRFEKQLFTEEVSIDPIQKQIINRLNQWCNQLCKVSTFTKKQMFPTIDENQSLQQLVIQQKVLYGSEEEKIMKKCKRAMIRVATFQGIIRSLESAAEDKIKWYEEYVNKLRHFNLQNLLQYYLKEDQARKKCFEKTKGVNLLVYTFQAMISEIKLLDGPKKSEEDEQKVKESEGIKVVSLSSIHRKKQFQEKLEEFFNSNNPNSLLIIYADLLNDSKNRINLCRSIINNSRTKRILNCKFDINTLPDKHICFVIRIDSTKDDQNISFGKDWRQYTVDLLNGKGLSQISMEQLMNNNLESLIKLTCDQQAIFVHSLVESMSKIYYNKDQAFIMNRIEKIQMLFQVEENIQYLKDMILMKVKQIDNFESLNANWKILVVKNEFFMKSNMTFHSAALEYIKAEIVKYLAFIIYYMEQDGIINAAQNKDLFKLAKQYFFNLYKTTYIHNRIQDMYYLAQNFDRIKFPLGRLIHQQFCQLKSQYVKQMKERQESEKEPKDPEPVDPSQVDLEDDLDKSIVKSKSIKLRDQERMTKQLRKLKYKDEQMKKMINELQSWCAIYFPREYIDQNILEVENEKYIEDFSYLIDNQVDQHSVNDNVSDYNKYIQVCLELILKKKCQSKYQIYGVFWKYENALINVWKIIQENIKLFSSDIIRQKLKTAILNHEDYNRAELTYLPREAFVKCVIQVFYELYYPKESLMGQQVLWEQNVKSTFQRLNDLAFYYLNDFKTEESRVVIFLLKFNHQVLKIFGTQEKNIKREQLFVQFAQEIKHIINQPQEIMRVLKENLQNEWNSNKDSKRKIFKFICDQLIEAFYNDDEFTLEYLLDEVMVHLVDPQDDLSSLQRDEKFNFRLQKIIYISQFLIEEDCQLAVLVANTEEYNDIIQDYPNYNLFDKFITKFSKHLKLSDPFLISLSDQMEDMIDITSLSDEDIKNKLQEIQFIILGVEGQQFSLLLKIIAVVVFKKIAKIYAEEISLWLEGEQFEQVHLQRSLGEFFTVDSNDQRRTLMPFAVYLIKILYQRNDILKIDQQMFVEKNNWVKGYLELNFSLNQEKFSFLKDQEYNTFKNDGALILNTNAENILKVHQITSMKKFCYYLAMIEIYYLQNKTLDKEQNLLQAGNAIIRDQYALNFLTPFVTGQFDLQVRNKFIKKEDNDKHYYFKILQTFLGAACLCNESSFLYEFFTAPQKIKDYFVPFVQNVKDDYDYFIKIQNNEHLSSLSCLQCKQIINLVIELSSEQVDLQRIHYLGDKIFCKNCKHTTDIENIKKASDKSQFINPEQFTTDGMAQKSYIPFEFEIYNEVVIRNLSSDELALGRIILHSLLMLTFCFTSLDNEIMALILPDYPYSDQEYATYVARTIQYLTNCFNIDWNYLKEKHIINDEKLLQLVQYVIVEIIKKLPLFKCSLLTKIEGRKEFERSFSQICVPIFKNMDLFFEKYIGFETDFEKYILEFNQVAPNDYYHLMRLQNAITINKFEEYVKSRSDGNFFKLLFEQKESIQNVQDLRDLVQWAKYIFNKWSAQITYDEANEMTFKAIIERESGNNQENKEYIQKIRKDFAKFKHAWNKYAGLIIRDKNVQVVIPTIDENSKLIICCITKDKQDQLGHIYYILLKYLAQKQNKVLQEAQKLFKQNQINSIAFPKIPFLSIKKDSILYFREKEAQILKRQQTMGNFEDKNSLLNAIEPNNDKQNKAYEKEKFEQIIIQRGSCSLKYGNGKQVEFNIEQIKNNTIELLLKGKCLIDIEDYNSRLNFQFVNIGNLYSYMAEVHKNIKQEKFTFAKIISRSFKSEFEIYHITQELKTALNFLFQSSEDPNFPLVSYLQQFKLQKLETHLAGEFYLGDMKLMHILSVYEELESKIWNLLLGNCLPLYRQELTEQQIQYLNYILKQEYYLIKPLLLALSRLIIRLLSFEQNTVKPTTELFKFIMREENQFLFGIGEEPDIELWSLVLEPCNATIQQTYCAYKLVVDLFKGFKEKIDNYEMIENFKNTEIQDRIPSFAQSKGGSSQHSVIALDEMMKQESFEEKSNFIRQSLVEVTDLFFDKADQEEQKSPSKAKKASFSQNRLIEEFIIIGADSEELNSLDVEKLRGPTWLSAQTQYMFDERSVNTKDPRKLQVNQFCFPNGVKLSKFDSSQLKDFVQNQANDFTKNNSFIFTVKTSESEEFDTSGENACYCICVIKDDLIEVKRGKKKIVLNTQKAYCIMSKYKYFDMHLQTLNSVLSLLRIERQRLYQKFKAEIYSDIDRAIQSILKTPLVCPEIQKLLQSYFELSPKDTSNILSKRESQGAMMQKQIQIEAEDLYWYAPLFFQLLSYQQFYEIWSALLMETSIIFISDSLPMLSSAAIGMQCFIEPFTWQNTSIPILPKTLLEMVSSPVPFIVGVLREYESEIIWDEISNECIIVDIRENEGTCSLTYSRESPRLPYFGGLASKIRKHFNIFNTKDELNQTEYNIKVRNSLRKISDLTKCSLKAFILHRFPVKILSGQEKFKSMDDLIQTLTDNCDESDREFVDTFKHSQSFAYYVDQKFVSLKSNTSSSVDDKEY